MKIELSELLTSLRSEINRARLQAADEDVRFRIDSIDLELQVAAEKSADVDTGVRFWVMSLGAKASVKSAEMHTVKLSLAAETSSGGPVLTGDDISGLLAAD